MLTLIIIAGGCFDRKYLAGLGYGRELVVSGVAIKITLSLLMMFKVRDEINYDKGTIYSDGL